MVLDFTYSVAQMNVAEQQKKGHTSISMDARFEVNHLKCVHILIKQQQTQ